MSDFELISAILAPYSEKLGTKIWICEKIGRRLSCIGRAGEESYEQAFVVYENEKYVLFAERKFTDQERQLAAQIAETVERTRAEVHGSARSQKDT